MKVTYKIGAWLIAAILLVALGGTAALWSFRQIEDAARVRQHTSSLINGGVALLSALKDAETGERGYLLTGDEIFLEPYAADHDNVVAQLKALRLTTLFAPAQKRLDAVAPLLEAKMVEMARGVDLRRRHDAAGAQALVATTHGKRLMDAIRVEMGAYLGLEQDLMAGHEAEFQTDLRRMLALIVSASVLALLLALAFVYLIYRETRQQIGSLVLLETRHLLGLQEETNKELQRTNASLRDSEEKLGVTLNSIGDAVIATDAEACLTLMNPVAEKLTGWTQAEARGRPVSEIFKIINQETRQPAAIPVMETLAQGTIQGLANHTLLISRDGSESAIADSCAPIRDRDGQVVGAVLVFRDVTHEYAAQQALHDSTALVQTVLNTVVDGVVTLQARGGMLETVNSATERMFGYSASQLAGQNFSLLIPELAREGHDASLEHYAASDEARASGLGREVSGRRQDGSLFPLEIAVTEMWLGGRRYFTGILRDISARKQAEEALFKAGALQRAIFDSVNFSSIATDAKGVIQIFNVGAERMLGYSAAEVMNKITPADISDSQEIIARAQTLSIELATPIAPGFEALAFKAARGIEDIYELTYIRKNGSRVPAVVSVTALRDAQNTIIGYLLIGTDNTARQRIEADRIRFDQMMQDKNTELERAKLVAEQANLAKSNFLSNMSHELRTPLSAILGFAQLIESGLPPPSASQKRSIDQILKAGWYLLELINEVLDLALIESGKLSLSLEPVSVAEVLRECHDMVVPQAQNRGLTLAFARSEIPCFVQADHTRLKQVLINLLSNAIKYNKEGGSVTVDCSLSRPEVMRISVRDTGAGLASGQIAQLFQPFNRLGQEVSEQQGTGIGLVVCKRLVELMGGVIGVESKIGKGSVFWIDLNVTNVLLAPAPVAAGSAALIAAKVPGDKSLRTLLYVEDNPANLMLVEDIVARRADIHLLSARDGNRGIEIARASRPDVILMDINLPGISGIAALKILRDDPATAHIPVIALSANAIPRDIERGLEAGFFRYLTKPIKVNEFLQTLDLALKFVQAANAARKE